MAQSEATKVARLKIRREYDNRRVQAGIEYQQEKTESIEECMGKKSTAWRRYRDKLTRAKARRRAALEDLSGRK